MSLSSGVRWLVYSNIWVSINVVSYYIFVALLLNLTIDYRYASLLFLSTLFAYNFQRLLKNPRSTSSGHASERHLWIGEHQSSIKALTVVGAIGSAVLAIWILPIYLIVLSLPALIIVLFYTRRNENQAALRNIPLAKILLISGVWVFVVLFVPLFLLKVQLLWSIANLAVPMLLYVCVLCIPFDIRDRKVDQGRLKTLPVVVGVKMSKQIGIANMVAISIWAVFSGVYAFALVSLFVIPSLIITSEDRKELFFTGWIEGQFMVLLLLQLLVEVI